jgi:hypothetical protein
MEESNCNLTLSEEGYETNGPSYTNESGIYTDVAIPITSYSNIDTFDKNSSYQKSSDINIPKSLNNSVIENEVTANNVIPSIVTVLGSAITLGEYIAVGLAGATVLSTISIPFAVIGIGIGTYEIMASINGTLSESKKDELELAYNPVMLSTFVLSSLNGTDKETAMNHSKNVTAINNLLTTSQIRDITTLPTNQKSIDALDKTIKNYDFFESLEQFSPRNDDIKSSILP